MNKFILFNRFFLILLVLAMIGCRESQLQPEAPDNHSKESQLKEEKLTDKKGFMTSRRSQLDSLGIAFNARVIGIFSSPSGGECKTVILEGHGKATHLAHINVVRSHCMREDKITEGEVKYTSFKGEELFGTYQGSRSTTTRDGSFTIEVVEEITEGTGRFAGVVGKITTTGTFHQDGTFSYTSDGWLLNTHANKQSK